MHPFDSGLSLSKLTESVSTRHEMLRRLLILIESLICLVWPNTDKDARLWEVTLNVFSKAPATRRNFYSYLA